jgi:hypothetical protein
MGYMGFGMQRWIYSQKPGKFQKYQEENTGHEILGYKTHEIRDPEILEHELKSLDERIEKSIHESELRLSTKIIMGVILILCIAAIFYFTLRG